MCNLGLGTRLVLSNTRKVAHEYPRLNKALAKKAFFDVLYCIKRAYRLADPAAHLRRIFDNLWEKKENLWELKIYGKKKRIYGNSKFMGKKREFMGKRSISQNF